jgi:solute carrier family 13 (sodium-dependent dicarboxylate transporter), member 2/3/5
MQINKNPISSKKKAILALGLFLFSIFIVIPPPEGLSVEGTRAIAVFFLCISFWVTAIIPLGITGLLGMALIPLLGVMSTAEAFSFFGDRALFFILGALILAAAIYKTGLGVRIAFMMLLRFDHRPKSIIAGILVIAALLSCIMPEHAVAAMLFPIVMEIAKSLGLKPGESNMGKAMFVAMAWGAIIGGVTTYLGGARNILAVGLLERNYGITVGFLEWIKYSFPLPLLIIGMSYFLIIKYFKPEIRDISAAYVSLEDKVKLMGKPSVNEKKMIVVLALVITAWLFLSGYVDIAVTALLGGAAVFIFKIITWEEMSGYMSWGVILMYGGAIVVATSLAESGATIWMAESIVKHLPLSGFIFIVLIALLTKGITEGISNVAAVAIILPVAFSTGSIIGVNPVATTLLVALSGGLAFCLPMGTPPNAIAFSSGYYSISEVVKVGIYLNIISIIVITLVALFYWPLVGLVLTN